jgi:hypothetical protein
MKEGSLMTKQEICIRSAQENDNDFIIQLSSRFNEFPMMSWRNEQKMLEA